MNLALTNCKVVYTTNYRSDIHAVQAHDTLPSSTDVLLQKMMMYHLLVHTLMVILQGQDADGDSSVMASASTNIETINTWCYCGQDETYDYMIGCDNEECSIQWFHLSCVPA